MGSFWTFYLIFFLISLCESFVTEGNTRCTFEKDSNQTERRRIEVHATLLPCSKEQQDGMSSSSGTTDDRIREMFHFSGFDKDDPIFRSDLLHCVNKLELTMKINNEGVTNTQEEFILIDEVLDPNTCVKLPLLYPYALKIQQLQVLQLYNLNFLQMVNGEAKEQVIDMDNPKFTGCDDSYDNPTCGLDYIEGRPVPFSQGFCCSCKIPTVQTVPKTNSDYDHMLLKLKVMNFSTTVPPLSSTESGRYDSTPYIEITLQSNNTSNGWRQPDSQGNSEDHRHTTEIGQTSETVIFANSSFPISNNNLESHSSTEQYPQSFFDAKQQPPELETTMPPTTTTEVATTQQDLTKGHRALIHLHHWSNKQPTHKEQISEISGFADSGFPISNNKLESQMSTEQYPQSFFDTKQQPPELETTVAPTMTIEVATTQQDMTKGHRALIHLHRWSHKQPTHKARTSETNGFANSGFPELTSNKLENHPLTKDNQYLSSYDAKQQFPVIETTTINEVASTELESTNPPWREQSFSGHSGLTHLHSRNHRHETHKGRTFETDVFANSGFRKISSNKLDRHPLTRDNQHLSSYDAKQQSPVLETTLNPTTEVVMIYQESTINSVGYDNTSSATFVRPLSNTTTLSGKTRLVRRGARRSYRGRRLRRPSRTSGVFRKPHHKLFTPHSNFTEERSLPCNKTQPEEDQGEDSIAKEREQPKETLQRESRSSFVNSSSILKHRYKRCVPESEDKQGKQRDCGSFNPEDTRPLARESAHCLRFSDIWYGVYELRTPTVEQELTLQVYGRKVLEDGSWHWQEMTPGKPVTLGSRFRHTQDETGSMSLRYSELGAKKFHFCLSKKHRLLLPQPDQQFLHPEIRGGPAEFLVVDKERVTQDGSRCDAAGVGYRAFATQPDRCSRPVGSCLLNQPIQMWRRDTDARLAGKKGSYFLENWCQLAYHPLVSRGGQLYISSLYKEKFSSVVRLQLRADLNSPLQFGFAARVTEVRTDATQTDATRLTAVVTNLGVAGVRLSIRMRPCGSWYAAESQMVALLPRQSSTLELQLPGQPSRDRLLCTLEVVNRRDEVIAVRNVRVQRLDRCACAWNCRCTCVLASNGLGEKSKPICGPNVTEPAPPTVFENIVMNMLVCLAVLLIILLFLGLLKAICGLCCSPVAAWGQDGLSDQRPQLSHYMEPSLRGRKVEQDVEGYPVHPDTYRRTVRLYPRATEFFLNVVFFLLWPVASCWRVCFRGPPDDSSTYNTWVHTVTLGDDVRRGVVARASQGQSNWNDYFYVDKNSRKEEEQPLMEDFEEEIENDAEELVESLLKVSTVFRTFDQPKGNIDFPEGIEYCIMGTFSEFGATGYLFKPRSPVEQLWGWKEGEVVRLYSPRLLRAFELERQYSNPVAVLRSGDLWEIPHGPVLNYTEFEP